MARIKIWIDPLHADGTVRTHATKPSGKPRDPRSGCKNYQVMCSEHGKVGKPHGLRVLAELAQSAHRDSHKAVPGSNAA